MSRVSKPHHWLSTDDGLSLSTLKLGQKLVSVGLPDADTPWEIPGMYVSLARRLAAAD